jgi:hypothetical protein
VLLFIRFLREGKGIGRTEDGENGAEKNGGGGWYLAMKKAHRPCVNVLVTVL